MTFIALDTAFQNIPTFDHYHINSRPNMHVNMDYWIYCTQKNISTFFYIETNPFFSRKEEKTKQNKLELIPYTIRKLCLMRVV